MLLCSISCCSLWGRFRDSELPKTASAWMKSQMHGPMAFATLASRRFRTMCILFALACVCTCELGQICRFAAIGLNLAFQTPLVHPILWETSNTWSSWLPRMVFWVAQAGRKHRCLGLQAGGIQVHGWFLPGPIRPIRCQIQICWCSDVKPTGVQKLLHQLDREVAFGVASILRSWADLTCYFWVVGQVSPAGLKTCEVLGPDCPASTALICALMAAMLFQLILAAAQSCRRFFLVTLRVRFDCIVCSKDCYNGTAGYIVGNSATSTHFCCQLWWFIETSFRARVWGQPQPSSYWQLKSCKS